ncbi:MAG: helix-turn-helix transcriptional regulator [Bacteroidota bacterium]
MSRREGNQRHRFIIHQLTKRASSFEDIQNFLQLQETLSEDKLTCSIRTFQRDMKEINEIYKIEIKCDKSQNLYYIAEDGREAQSERLMETFDLFNAIKMGNSFGNHLIFENRKALGTEHMHGLLHSIRNRQEVSFTYKKYNDSSLTERTVRPVAIKESRNRWYLLAQDTKDKKIKNFSLDRMSNLEVGRKKFREIKDYDPVEEFRDIFGIINGTGEKPQKIVLSFTPQQGRYINSLPLHASQQEILKDKNEHRFEYYLAPTHDFKMEILSHGDQVQVLEPESLRKDIIAQLQKNLEAYNS